MTKFFFNDQDKQYVRTSVLFGAVSGSVFGTVVVAWLLIAYMVFAPSMARYGVRKGFEAVEVVDKEMAEKIQLETEEYLRANQEMRDDMDRYDGEHLEPDQIDSESYLSDFDESILDRHRSR